MPFREESGKIQRKADDLKVYVAFATDKSENDLVEYRWTYRGVKLQLTDSRNAMQIEIPLDREDPAALSKCKAIIADIVQQSGKDPGEQPFEVDFDWLNRIDKGSRMSSDPQRRIGFLLRWTDRIDAVVGESSLSILLYKPHQPRVGTLNGWEWFPEDFGPPDSTGTQPAGIPDSSSSQQ